MTDSQSSAPKTFADMVALAVAFGLNEPVKASVFMRLKSEVEDGNPAALDFLGESIMRLAGICAAWSMTPDDLVVFAVKNIPTLGQFDDEDDNSSLAEG